MALSAMGRGQPSPCPNCNQSRSHHRGKVPLPELPGTQGTGRVVPAPFLTSNFSVLRGLDPEDRLAHTSSLCDVRHVTCRIPYLPPEKLPLEARPPFLTRCFPHYPTCAGSGPEGRSALRRVSAARPSPGQPMTPHWLTFPSGWVIPLLVKAGCGSLLSTQKTSHSCTQVL